MSEDTTELTAELVVDRVVPSQPVISPDGCWVAYAVAPAGRKTERRMYAIWLAAVDGSSPPAKLTAITLTASLIDQAERFLPELVTSARLNGHTWHDIAQADAELRRRHPDQKFPALRSAEPGLATEAQRDELTLTTGEQIGSGSRTWPPSTGNSKTIWPNGRACSSPPKI